jgi:hypothetical protein
MKRLIVIAAIILASLNVAKAQDGGAWLLPTCQSVSAISESGSTGLATTPIVVEYTA